MDFLAFIGINDVDTAREGNIDKWFVTAIGVLGRILSLVSHIRRLGVGTTVSGPSASLAASPYSSLSNDTHTARRAQ